MIMKRVIAFIIDEIVLFLLFYLCLLALYGMSIDINESMIYYLFTALSIILISIKDCINGISPGKFVVGLQVIDRRTLKAATPIQCIIRNLFCLIWGIEIFVILFSSTGLRLGDRIARTMVIRNRK